ncbi:LytR C-terminal domain-containing protein [Patescibacteria group bacterium]|nr:LytR C-terminal domain-containing protein [Patescibacteria group bacterium]
MGSDIDISLAKIVATPSQSSWAQAYSAGKLFAVLSLEKKIEKEEEQEEDFLNLLGKELLNTLEEEFFTLETKDLASIKTALLNTSAKIPQDVSSSFVVASQVNNVLYIFIIGTGEVDIKRGDEFGTLLKSQEESHVSIKAASGLLQDGDIIILQTKQFTDIITDPILSSSLDSKPPEEIAEILAPLIHEAEKGGSAAIIIKIKENTKEEISAEGIKENEQDFSEESSRYFSKINKYLSPFTAKIKQSSASKLNHSRKIFLTVALILLIVFVLAVNFAVKKQEDSRIHALFEKTYPEALKKYDEGQSLLGLNKNLARDSFTASWKILDAEKSKFPKNSKEEKQILDLLEKVTKELEANSPEKIAQDLNRSKISISIENGSGLEGTAGKASDFLKGKGYNIVSTANADNYNYKGTTIKVKNSTNAYLDLLRKDLSEKYTVSNTSSDLPQDFTADVLVIIGK